MLFLFCLNLLPVCRKLRACKPFPNASGGFLLEYDIENLPEILEGCRHAARADSETAIGPVVGCAAGELDGSVIDQDVGGGETEMPEASGISVRPTANLDGGAVFDGDSVVRPSASVDLPDARVERACVGGSRVKA